MNFWFLGVPVRAVEPRNPKMGWLISNRLRGNISVETTGYFSGNQWFPMVCAHFSATHADNQRFLDVLSIKSCVSCVDRLWKNTRRCSCRAYVPTLGSTTVLPHQNHLTILTFVHPHGILIDRCFFHTHMYIYIYIYSPIQNPAYGIPISPWLPTKITCWNLQHRGPWQLLRQAILRFLTRLTLVRWGWSMVAADLGTRN